MKVIYRKSIKKYLHSKVTDYQIESEAIDLVCGILTEYLNNLIDIAINNLKEENQRRIDNHYPTIKRLTSYHFEVELL